MQPKVGDAGACQTKLRGQIPPTITNKKPISSAICAIDLRMAASSTGALAGQRAPPDCKSKNARKSGQGRDGNFE